MWQKISARQYRVYNAKYEKSLNGQLRIYSGQIESVEPLLQSVDDGIKFVLQTMMIIQNGLWRYIPYRTRKIWKW